MSGELNDKRLNPWLSIWTKPRATIRQIVEEDPERLAFTLAALWGIHSGLMRSRMFHFGDRYPITTLLLFVLIGGSIGGVLALYLWGFLLRLTGSWLGGTAEANSARAALAWSQVPTVGKLVLWIPYYATYGPELFSTHQPQMDANPFPALAVSLLALALALWGFVILLKCLGEVHGFSAWRALGATLIALLLFAAVVGIPVITVVLVMRG